MVQIKNYLVGCVRPVVNYWGYWQGTGPNPNWEKDFNSYADMYKISRQSAKKFLQGTWKEVALKSPVLDARMNQIATYYAIKEMWHQEPCNILFMGSDTMFIKPTEFFGKYREMRLFNYTDPRSHAEHSHYLNDDIRYYPATMDSSVWELGEQLMAKWFSHKESDWSWGQLLHNHQIWSQGLTPEQMIDPTMAFQVVSLDENHSNSFNGCTLAEAKVLHFHGSRNAGERNAVMLDIAKQMDIDVDSE